MGRLEKDIELLEKELFKTLNKTKHLFQLYSNYNKIEKLYKDKHNLFVEYTKLEFGVDKNQKIKGANEERWLLYYG
jgi:phosphoribosylaminoimidazole-succinocarboxamide synthase